MNRIITIGREFGSGGREIGRALAEKLQIAYYDHEIVTEISKRTDLAVDYIQRIQEKRPFPFMNITVGRSFWTAPSTVLEQQLTILKQESEIIREMAERSDCVIVGRCADYVLRDNKPFRLFFYAEMDYKLARCREKQHDSEVLSDRELRKQIKQMDKNRSEYYELLSGQTWGAKENYDLCVNTTNADLKSLVSGIAAFL